MIVGDLMHWPLEKGAFAAPVRAAIEYASGTAAAAFERGGRPEAIMDGRIFAMLQQYETLPQSRCRPESHRRQIDIHLILEGEERIGVSRLCAASPAAADSPQDQDLLFYDAVEAETDVVMKPGMYAVLFPGDIHRPRCQSGGSPSAVRKIVVKIDVGLLEQ